MMTAHSARYFCPAVLFLLLSFGVAVGATIYVPDQHATIQAAITAAAPGDTVVVRPGTYPENIYFLGKEITVASESGPSVTVIDGGQAGSVVNFIAAEGPAAVIEGFTITNGSGTFIWNGDFGGGVICRSASPTIRGNVITANTTSNGGGGIYAEDGNPVIAGNEITGNSVAFSGAGIHLLESGGTIEQNLIADNLGFNDGGGIYCYAYDVSLVIRNNEITGNSSGWGGGISCRLSASHAEIRDNQVAGNSAATSGGGIYERGVETVVGNSIIGNGATVDGGGFFGFDSVQLFANNTVCGNRAGRYGGGLRFYYTMPTITHNTISMNIADVAGGGVSLFATLSLTSLANSIVWGNSAPDGQSIHLGGEYHGFGFIAVGYSDVEGGMAGVSVGPYSYLHVGPGLIVADPLFIGSSCDDYHLAWSSPCRDSGSNTYSGPVTEDFEGDPRTALGTADMGADEFWFHLYTIGDVVPGGSIAIHVAGKPQAPVTLFLGAGVEEPPLGTQHGDLHIQWPPLWKKGLGTIPSTGILSFQATVPSAWAPGKTVPFQALIGRWGANFTRWSNLLLLTAE